MNELCSALRAPLTSLRDYDSFMIKPTINDRFGFFDKYTELNREHQNAALVAARAAMIGQIVSPCGTGKTRIQICLHVAKLIELALQQEYGVTAIASHRLALNRQLCDELVDVMVRCGLSFDVLCIGSDRLDTKKYYVKYAEHGYTPDTSRQLGSLSSKEIEKFIEQARELGRHVLVVSTYNSIDRLQNVGLIDLLTHDEAHNIVREDFTENIGKVKLNVAREYFFTATRKVRGQHDGMKNIDFYGELLIDIKAQDMLNKGEIACPRIHSVGGANDETTSVYNTHMLVKNTIEAFEKHKEHIRADSFNHDEIGAKIIVGCVGIQEMNEIYNYPEFKEWAAKANVPCFSISSRGGGAECYVNGRKVSREEFFMELNGLSDAEDALIFNVDMLSEGIDLPAITGVMPMRNLDTIKLIQLLGRALRLTKRDRTRLYSGEIVPGDYHKYVKPYGHLILPKHLNSCNEFERMKEIVRDIYVEYGTPIEELVIQDKYIKPVPNDLDSMIARDLDGGKDYQLQHTVMDVVAGVSEYVLNKITANDRRAYLGAEEISAVPYVQPGTTEVHNMIQHLLAKHGA